MAVYLVDTCNAYRVSMESTDAGFQPLGNYFGSVGGGAGAKPRCSKHCVMHSAIPRTCSPAGMLTLWQAMTGGLDWASVMSPLLEPHPHHRLLMCWVFCFCFLAFWGQMLAIVEDQRFVRFQSAVLLIVTETVASVFSSC